MSTPAVPSLLLALIGGIAAIVAALLSASGALKSAQLTSSINRSIAGEVDKTGLLNNLTQQVRQLTERVTQLETARDDALQSLYQLELTNVAQERKLNEAERSAEEQKRKVTDLQNQVLLQRGEAEERYMLLQQLYDEKSRQLIRLQAEYDLLSEQYKAVQLKLAEKETSHEPD